MVEHTVEAQQHTVDAQHPWPWLDPFTEAAQAFFHGRRDDIDGLLRSVLAAHAGVLFGRSGLGKSSLLLAGLFPMLRERAFLPIAVRLEHTEKSAGLSSQLLRALGTAVTDSKLQWVGAPTENEGGVDDVAVLWERLHNRKLQLMSADERRWTPVFVLDQFEEIFTLLPEGDRRLRAFRELGDLIENRLPPAVAARLDRDDALLDAIDLDNQRYRCLLSIREDFLPDLEGWTDLIPRLGPNRYRLLPMSAPQALEAVEQTGGNLVEHASAELIVEFLGRQSSQSAGARAAREDRRIEPALLSLVCASLNADRLALKPPGSRLDVSNLETRGTQILDAFYDSAFADLSTDDANRARKWVEENLITPGGARRPYPLKAIDADLLDAVRHLIARRLMRIENTERGDQVELVHDRLAAVAQQRARAARQRTQEAQRLREEKELAERKLQEQRAASERKLLEQRAASERELLQQHAAVEKERADRALQQKRSLRRWMTALAVLAGLFLATTLTAYVQRETARAETAIAKTEKDNADEARKLAEAARAAAENATAEARKAREEETTAREEAEKRLEAFSSLYVAHDKLQQAVETSNKDDARRLIAESNQAFDTAVSTLDLKKESCPSGMRVYPQIGQQADSATIDRLAPTLRNAGFIVPKIEVVSSMKMPPTSEIRYFRLEYKDGADAAVAALQGALPGVKAQLVRGFENSTSIRPCHYELWLAVGDGMVAATVTTPTPGVPETATTRPLPVAPKITILSDGTATDAAPYELRAQVEPGDARSEVGTVTVQVNNEGPLPVRVTENGELRQSVKLSPGSNLLLVEAAEKTNSVPANRGQRLVFMSSKDKPTLYLRTVSVTRSAEKGSPEISYANRDAEDIEDSLQRWAEGSYSVSDDHLTNPSADAFLRNVTAAAREARPQDVIVIFFSGPTTSAEQPPALVFNDYSGTQSRGLVSSLTETLRGTNAQKVLLFVDSWQPDSGTQRPLGSALLNGLPGSHVAVSATVLGRDASWAKALPRGLVTEALLRAIDGAAIGEDSTLLDAWSLQKYIETAVTYDRQNEGVTPQTYRSGENFALLPVQGPVQKR